MDLKPIKCPECGADLHISEGQDIVVCEYCGTSISVKDITATASGSSTGNLITLAKTALDSGNFKEAFDYYNKVLEISSSDASAWFGKGVTSGGLSNINDIRIDEMVVSFENAIKYSKTDKQDEMKRNSAVEINKAIMNMLSNFKGGPEFFINPQGSGGFSVSLGNIMGNVKQLADEGLRAMEKAHEWMPDNREIANNLQMIKNRIGELDKIPDRRGFNLQSGVTGTTRRRSSFSIFKLAFLIIIIAGGYLVVKNYVLPDKTVNNIINRVKEEQEIKPKYSLIKTASQNGTVCISVFTSADNDRDLGDINREVVANFSEKYKQLYVNFFSDKNSGDKNSNLQLIHNNDWITEHAEALSLTATYEYRSKDKYSRFYKYVEGSKIDIAES